MLIKTKQFIIRPYKLRDAKILAKAINSKKISDNLVKVPYPYKLSDAKKFIAKALHGYRQKQPNKLYYAIEIDGELAGGIGLSYFVPAHQTEIAYWLAEKYWGKGIMTKVVKKVTDYLFDKFKLKRIYGEVFKHNIGSIKVLEKVGFKVEGLLKKEIKKNKQFIDAYIMAKIKR